MGDDNFDPGLFLNEECTLFSVNVGGLDETLEASSAASTEYDLTGQVIWPVSRLLALYMHEERERLKGKRVLELGAGVGCVQSKPFSSSAFTPHSLSKILNVTSLTRQILPLDP